MIEFLEVKTRKQIEAVAALAQKIWHEHYDRLLEKGQVDYMLHAFQSADAIESAIQSQGYTYYLVRCDGMEIGYIGLQPQEDGSLFLSKLYIDAPARGKGFGRECLAYVCDRARRMDCRRVWLTVNRDNAGSIAVYKHFGFRIFDSQNVDIGGGYTMDDYFMEKQL